LFPRLEQVALLDLGAGYFGVLGIYFARHKFWYFGWRLVAAVVVSGNIGAVC
jgi:hypothetical protein